MRKVYVKLIAMSLALLLSVTMVIMSSYAWLVLSSSPAVNGIQVAIGGGNTILTAANVKYTAADGKIYNIPGRFSDKLNFGQQEDYSYLQELGKLTPVSTVNGIDWFIPDYYTTSDLKVQQGRVPNGTMKEFSEFKVDSFLAHANLDAGKEEDREKAGEGSYIYLDFWVVSPGGDYKLRISTGEGTEAGGSFVIDLLEPSESGNGYVLAQPSGSASAAVRVGFLANDTMLTDDSMLHYKNSKTFDERFSSLRGVYQEPNTGALYLENEHFTIYEPNGDYHPAFPERDGMYVETKPLGLVKNQTVEQSVRGRLTVQRKSTWAQAENGVGTAVEQRFQTALIAVLAPALEERELSDLFYSKYLQGQISPYVSKGKFFASTGKLYGFMNENGVVGESSLGNVEQAGATDDVYIIELERNVPQRIRMFIWLEGQDMDCVDGVDSSRFAVNIELAGGEI